MTETAKIDPEKKIRAIIIDDESAARDYIQYLLLEDDIIEVIGEAVNGFKAVEEIVSKKPDLVFLDIQMPAMDGFEVIKHIEKIIVPQIIFVTAHDKYALKAFEVHALDYLLKPFDRDRFFAAVSRAKKVILSQRKRQIEDRMNNLLKSLKTDKRYFTRLLIKSKARFFFIQTNDIAYIQAAGNYIIIYVEKTEHLLRQTLSSMEEKLDPEKFVRIHRSAIVNIDRIKEIKTSMTGDYTIHMLDGKELVLSRKYKDRLLSFFSR